MSGLVDELLPAGAPSGYRILVKLAGFVLLSLGLGALGAELVQVNGVARVRRKRRPGEEQGKRNRSDLHFHLTALRPPVTRSG